MQKHLNKMKLQFVECECGEEILLVPDIGKMAQAIERHAREHVFKEHDSKKSVEILGRIEEALVQKTLQLAAKQIR